MTITALNEVVTTPVRTVSPDTYRKGMAGLAAAVNIVTTEGPQGPAGFTATAVCSVSDDPATLLVCLNRGASVHSIFAQSQHLAINTLTSVQSPLSNLFGGKAPMAERFESGAWATSANGSPVLSDAAVCFDCVITEIKNVATHDVLFCQVTDIRLNEEADALLYYQRGYHSVCQDV
ncbi:flavin reductase [Salinimonas lutimaris]|uniref:flavin reductase n=1 Tax=Salinimonas lutimaris TaxID=914153 RepID=UPI0010C01F91|nr:flavin reductase [Salinimonas lutimaris]